MSSEPMKAQAPNGGAVRREADSTGAGLGAREGIEYHAQCPKNQLNCVHWVGLKCGDVDNVMLNLRRYERDYAQLALKNKDAQEQRGNSGERPVLEALRSLLFLALHHSG